MGVSYFVYVGPYIEAPNPEKVRPREFHSCPDKKCRNHKKEMSEKFCPQCGTAITLITVQSVKRAEFDVYEECKDRLSDVHHDYLPPEKQNSAIFQPNQGKFGQRFSAYDSSIVAFNETMIADEMSRFRTFFAKDIDRIKEVFGNAIVQWGVVAYAS